MAGTDGGALTLLLRAPATPQTDRQRELETARGRNIARIFPACFIAVIGRSKERIPGPFLHVGTIVIHGRRTVRYVISTLQPIEQAIILEVLEKTLKAL